MPAASTAVPIGRFRLALVAAPPSPEKLSVPLPATVVIVPAVWDRRATPDFPTRFTMPTV
jgi:hypothetical protein